MAAMSELQINSSEQRRLTFLQNKLTPYFIILLFSGSIALVRLYMIAEWAWYLHLGGFVVQVFVLIGVWRMIRVLNGYLDKIIPFKTGPLQRMFIQIVITLILLSPLVAASILLARPYLPSFVNSQFLAVLAVMFVLTIVLFNFSFYVSYFYQSWQRSIEEKARIEVQAADLERERFNLQYHQLKNQVNPHYLFNTLTSLDGLIQTNPELASEFVRHMAKVYRYVLQHKENEIVSLEEELEFIDHYLELLQVRYKQGLTVHCNVSADAKEKGIVMVTIQMLIDNAIKHNVAHAASPLKIAIWDEDAYLHVFNNKQLREQMETSNKQGLNQLVHFYSYLTDQPIVIDDKPEYFLIKIPLLLS